MRKYQTLNKTQWFLALTVFTGYLFLTNSIWIISTSTFIILITISILSRLLMLLLILLPLISSMSLSVSYSILSTSLSVPNYQSLRQLYNFFLIELAFLYQASSLYLFYVLPHCCTSRFNVRTNNLRYLVVMIYPMFASLLVQLDFHKPLITI